MTEKEAIYDYLGDPLHWPFSPDQYTGPKGGLINLVGLKHLGLVSSGSELYSTICEYYNTNFNRWKFYHELTTWCSRYTGTADQVINIGKQQIRNGVIEVSRAKYFCMPVRVRQQLINEN